MTAPTSVLIVEDNLVDAHVARAALEAAAAAFDVAHVETLEGALARLADAGADVVLLDLNLPDSRGLETLDAVRSQFPELPIVVLTAAEDDDGTRALRAGAQDFLPKADVDRPATLARAVRYAVERQRMQRALLALSLTDELTGLYNRRGFLALAHQQLRLLARQRRGALLLFADLDRFKEINDTYGHREGDVVLVAVASLLRDAFRSSDTAARLGGDEFVVLAADARLDTGSLVVGRVRERLAAYNESASRPYQVAMSLGLVTVAPGDSRSLDELLAAADALLYEEKRAKGRTGSAAGTRDQGPVRPTAEHE